MQRNLPLLKERAWFDIPIVYNNGRRAILALEKGTPGERAFEEAFKAWGQTSANLARPPDASSGVLAPSPGVAIPNPLQVTIPEGLTSEQIVTRLAEVDFLGGNILEIPKEGTLLPGTYNFPRGTAREHVIQRIQQEHARVLKEIWDRRSPEVSVASPEQLVTLASIVEKETGKSDERSRVAAVLMNRLRQQH